MDGRARGQGILNDFSGYRCREGAASADGKRTCRSGGRAIPTAQSSPKQETRGDQMKITSGRTAVGTLLLQFVLSSSVLAQQASLRRNVILRRDPSTSSPVLAHLAKGVRIMLVDASPDSGFYHVRTEDDQIGWVFSKYVTVPESVPPGTPADAGTSTTGGPSPAATCDSNLWNHVYHSYRLIVKQQCIAVTGTIVNATATQRVKQPDGVRHEGDGDTRRGESGDRESESTLYRHNMREGQ